MVKAVVVEADFAEGGNMALGFTDNSEVAESGEVSSWAFGVGFEMFNATGVDADGGEYEAGYRARPASVGWTQVFKV